MTDEKLPLRVKLAYGVGDVGPAIVAAVYGFFLNAFLLDVAGLPPALAGVVLLVSRLWDAVNDPLVGTLSDRTRSKFGRRRPWILYGALPFGLAFFLLWLVPPLPTGGKFIYYLVVVILLDTSFTVVNTPYTALTPELTDDYDERTSLNAFRFSFSILGGVVAAALHTVIVGGFENTFTGHAVSAAVWGTAITATALLMFWGVPEESSEEKELVNEDTPGFIEGLGIALKNRAFVLVSLVFMLSWIALQFVQNNLQLYFRYWIRGPEATFTPLILTLQISAFVFLIIWSRISEVIGKKAVYYAGMGFWIVCAIALFFVKPGQIALLFVLAVGSAVGLATAYLVPWSMLPDVCELDELETGQRREGVYYGVFAFLQKFGIGLALAASNFALAATGYINATPGQPFPEQPASALLALRFFVGPVAAVILVLGILAVAAFPITRESHAETVAELERRRAAQAGD